MGQREKCLRKRPQRGSFPGLAWVPDAKPAFPGAGGRAVDQNRLKLAGEGRSVYKAGWNRRLKTEIPVYGH